MQHVHIGMTQSGQRGFFTGYTLAWGFSEEFLADLDAATSEQEKHALLDALAKRLGFKLED